ncbi:MAG: family 16 glycosylhydrolase [Hyphomonadaceae bacterium]
MRQTVVKSAIDHGSARTDVFIIALVAALCIFELGLLSQFTSPASVEIAPAQVIIAEAEIAPLPVPVTPEPIEPVEPVAPLEIPEAPAEIQIASAPAFITLFGTGDNALMWERSAHHNPDGFFGVDWNTENVAASVDGLALVIEDNEADGNPYTSAEVHSKDRYGFGRYEVVMRPARGSGLVSAFFTYSGPHFGEPHDEIDIEFLGSDTTQVHFNYYRKGVKGAYQTVDLPFDAADADHLYAFEWRADGIEWFIDGVSAYRTPPGDTHIPQTPAKIILNVWTGKPFMAQWHGEAQFRSGSTVDFACTSYRPVRSDARSCATFFGPREAPVSPSLMLSGSWATRAVMTARAQQPG